MKYQSTLFKVAKIKHSDTTNAGEDVEKLENSYIAGETVKQYSHTGKHLAVKNLNM